MKRRYTQRRRSGENNEEGQDSFLDIVSNIVGILIILVMIAGAQVGAVHPQDETNLSPENQGPSETEKKEYIDVCQQFLDKAQTLKTVKEKVSELNNQLALVRQQADGVEEEQSQMAMKAGSIRATIELVAEKNGRQEKDVFDQKRHLLELTEELQGLELSKKSLESSSKKIVTLENVPSQLGKKVEGHEGFFCLRNSKVSHVPMNIFKEHLRGYFQQPTRRFQENIDDQFGPVENYYFHFQASLHESREPEGLVHTIVFDLGECIPVNNNIGESVETALKNNSDFQQKLKLYLQDTSTITLFVYPDSFNELRILKKFLMDNGYNIAFRPMPVGQEITFSPNGSASKSY